MLKKSIPAILGALLLGTSAEAGTIKCPTVVDLNYTFLAPYDYAIDISKPKFPKLTFADKSSVVAIAGGKNRVKCFYDDGEDGEVVLSVDSNQKCTIPGVKTEEKGDLGAKAKIECNNSPACRTIVCK